MHEPFEVLILNPGSSTIKGAVFSINKERVQKVFYFNEKLNNSTNYFEIVLLKIKSFNIKTIGIRVVHALKNYQHPILWNKNLEKDIQSAKTIAPIHNEILLNLIKNINESILKDVPIIACFDSSFYYELPELAKMIPVPKTLKQNGIIEKLGFHGYAHHSMIKQYLNHKKLDSNKLRILSLQLGSGCSITASKGGKPIDTSMGYTPLDGLIMANRCGSIDPGLILYWLKSGISINDLEKQLNYSSGMQSLAATNDFKKIIEEETEQNHFAIEVFCQAIVKCIGSYIVQLGGVDVIIFGGGVGENAPSIRKKVIDKLDFLNIYLDDLSNASNYKLPLKISNQKSIAEVFVIQPDEESEMNRDVLQLLQKVSE